MFDHEYAIEEIFSRAVLAFERNWENIQASFPALLEAMLASLREGLLSLESLAELSTSLESKESKKKGFFKRIESLKKDKKLKSSGQEQEVRVLSRLKVAWTDNDAKTLSEMVSEGSIPANQIDPTSDSGISLLHKVFATHSTVL